MHISIFAYFPIVYYKKIVQIISYTVLEEHM